MLSLQVVMHNLILDAIAAIDGVNLVIGTNNRSKIVELVEQLETTERQINAVRDIMKESNFEEMPLFGNESDKSRAFMKNSRRL